MRTHEPDQNGGKGKGVLREASGEHSCLLLNLHCCGLVFVLFLLVGRFWFLPVDRKGKQPVQQDWKPQGAGHGFFILQVLRIALQPSSQSQFFFLTPPDTGKK